MAISTSRPMPFTPRGLTDAYDATEKFPGACRKLVNLVFDGSNRELVVSRPGVTQLASFVGGGFAGPGFVSVQASVGTRVYGMIASTRFAGKDEPFCFDTATGLFVTISGVLNANTPTSPATFGDWTPPTMTVVGIYVLITHPGFSGAPGIFFGVIDVSNAASPAWSAANTTTNALPHLPQAVANFNNRGYFAVRNQLFYTDDLSLTITNASQFLTIGDQSYITALAGLPMTTTSSGVLQALTVYKATQIWQITGDTTFTNLAQNYVSLNVGTLAPRTVAQSPSGQYFMSTGGIYFLDLLGTLRPVCNSPQDLEPDLQAPFIGAQTPSRWAAAYNSNIYRLCGASEANTYQLTGDYWFDERKRRWTGPHTFAYDCASAVGGFFVLSSAQNPAVLIKSPPLEVVGFTTMDLGSRFACNILTSTFPKTGDMATKQVTESQIELAVFGGPGLFSITPLNEAGQPLAPTADLYVTQVGQPWGTWFWGLGYVWTAGNVWGGAGDWGGGGIWGAGTPAIPRTYPIPWEHPLNFEKMALAIDFPSATKAIIGTSFHRYQQTGYMVTRGYQ